MILLLGGTTESLAVADELTKHKVPFVLSVISDYGAELARRHAKNIVETTFTDESLLSFCHDNQISFILDATHPFARVISQLAMDKPNELQIPYLRYERQNIYSKNAKLRMVDSLEEACEYLRTVK
ncbi:precorrin-6A/cobalt-precorrin-6A reductase, partial [Limosilactobacillus reuteri]|uniref:precorrin-6A/cobalt-precorrin-6A reductase n=1 Tax=Limosilactobacillus reuteri TaxID=1598 RepID=UPI00117B47D8